MNYTKSQLEDLIMDIECEIDVAETKRERNSWLRKKKQYTALLRAVEKGEE